MRMINSFINPLSINFGTNQKESLKTNFGKSENSFEDILKNTAREKSSSLEQRDNSSIKCRDNKNVEPKKIDDVKTQRSEINQNNEVKDESNSDAKVAKKENINDEKNNKDDKFSTLTNEEKEIAKEVADKLNIKPEVLMDLLQALNIDFKNLVQTSADTKEMLGQITTAIESSVEKFKLNPIAVDNKDIRAKIQLLLNAQKNNQLKVEDESKNVNLDPQVNDKIQTTKETNVKVLERNENEVATVQLQPEIDAKPQKDNQKVETGSQAKTDVSGEATKKSFMQNSNNSSGEMANNRQNPQDAGKGDAKTDDTVDMQSILNNAKVINLKTTQKEQGADSVKIDTQNVMPMQNFESNRVIPMKQTVQNISGQKDSIFSQIVENAKITLGDTQTEMEMDLKPESLGKLSIKIASENGLIMAKITTENEQVKAVIESNLTQLKEQLEKQGLSIQDFSVSVGQDKRQQFFANQNSNSKAARVQGTGKSTVMANESYVKRIMVNNPYLMSDSSIDYTA